MPKSAGGPGFESRRAHKNTSLRLGPRLGAGYGLTDAVNGKLWPPLNITLPVTMVPGTPAALTVAVWAPTGMTP